MSNQKYFGGLLFRAPLLAGVLLTCHAAENLLQNSGFENAQLAPHWSSSPDSPGNIQLTTQEAHSGRASLALPGQSAITQETQITEPGPYLFRCWVRSATEQAVTVVMQNPLHPAANYTYADLKVPKGGWTQIKAFCAVPDLGPFTVTIGGMSPEFRRYHGGTSEMRGPILIDDCELVRFQPPPDPGVSVWDTRQQLVGVPELSAAASWAGVTQNGHAFQGTPVFRDAQLTGVVRAEDGGLALYATVGPQLKLRGVLKPEADLGNVQCSFVQTGGKSGIRVRSAKNDRSYTVWCSPRGVIEIEPQQVPRFSLTQSQLRYGLLPSFVGADVCYAPRKMTGTDEVRIPSTQWFVGLRDGNESMLVAVWKSAEQAASLGLSGTGTGRVIDSLSLGTEPSGFALAFVEHPHLWSRQTLNEDWLGEYTPLDWERPFEARWMAHFFVTAGGGKASFRTPHMSYSFPVADAKTRMWGVWFEDWNHYPFSFDHERLIAHFEKTFVPNGEALLYFLQPAAAEVISPCEVVEQALGKEKAAALFDLNGNQIRKLHYSTPNEFMYDRPVCATTTRLSGIKKEEKPTVGVNLATHLYEFIREIRGRVDQYVAFFDQMNAYLDSQERANPQGHAYLAPLQALVTEARSKSKEIYDTPLAAVQTKADAMKKLLEAGKGDGFDCGNLDVRGPAGAQDDLCRRYNRLVLRLNETAALTCANSAAQAAVAAHIWQESHRVLREPTRWEPRRTLYFFEP